MTAIEYKIEHFFGAIERLYDFASDNCGERIEGLILACAYLDSLAGYKYKKKTTVIDLPNSYLITPAKNKYMKG